MSKTIRLMTDYTTTGLWWNFRWWEKHKKNNFGEIDYEELPLSQETVDCLKEREKAYWEPLEGSLRNATPEQKALWVADFDRQGVCLWRRLKQELAPEYKVVYFSEKWLRVIRNPEKLEDRAANYRTVDYRTVDYRLKPRPAYNVRIHNKFKLRQLAYS